MHLADCQVYPTPFSPVSGLLYFLDIQFPVHPRERPWLSVRPPTTSIPLEGAMEAGAAEGPSLGSHCAQESRVSMDYLPQRSVATLWVSLSHCPLKLQRKRPEEEVCGSPCFDSISGHHPSILSSLNLNSSAGSCMGPAHTE